MASPSILQAGGESRHLSSRGRVRHPGSILQAGESPDIQGPSKFYQWECLSTNWKESCAQLQRTYIPIESPHRWLALLIGTKQITKVVQIVVQQQCSWPQYTTVLGIEPSKCYVITKEVVPNLAGMVQLESLQSGQVGWLLLITSTAARIQSHQPMQIPRTVLIFIPSGYDSSQFRFDFTPCSIFTESQSQDQ